jgi:hypothetical protein
MLNIERKPKPPKKMSEEEFAERMLRDYEVLLGEATKASPYRNESQQ